MKRSCFVIMPIGEQIVLGKTITASDLRKRYDDLIKGALLLADPDLEVMRADDLAMPGTVSTDILKRLMQSDIVVADVTFPNPNVFYELGLRHACRTGTILIKDSVGPQLPFDLSHQRYIPYENTVSGLKELSQKFQMYLDYFSKDSVPPDNHFLELAMMTKYSFPRYDESPQPPFEVTAMKAMLKSPEIIELFTRQRGGEPVDQKELFEVLVRNPDFTETFTQALAASGQLSLGSSGVSGLPNRSQRRSQQNKGGKKK